MRPPFLLAVLIALLLTSACTTAYQPEPVWKRPGAQETTLEQLHEDQDQCRRKAEQETARRLMGYRPGPEHFEQKRALIFQCMEEKGWVWHGDKRQVPRQYMTK